MSAIAISTAEWQVMQVIWEEHPIGASDVVDRLATASRSWHPKTVRTLLGRLVRKGALDYREDGKRYLYSPRVSREECARRESASFVERVFRGNAAPAAVYLLEDADLTSEEVDRLQELLDAKRPGASSRRAGRRGPKSRKGKPR